MSLLKQTTDAVNSIGMLKLASPVSLISIRTATKRASGSKTNKNDSAGRRLGPKVYESHFVKPGQIIMRQRGTTIHPGENTGIGKDHTVFALEPGYVRFYYNPFHPLRKFVGVALKKELTLPTPHFEPRVRRFGYQEILDKDEAIKEESHMSRKEYLQQPELKKTKEKSLKRAEYMLNKYTEQLKGFPVELSEEELKLSSKRLLEIFEIHSSGQTIEEAGLQATFNYVFENELKLRRKEISQQEFNDTKQKYFDLTNKLDQVVTVDASGNLCPYISPEAKQSKKDDIMKELDTFKNRVLKLQDQELIKSLISTPAVFTKHERKLLVHEYLPKVLPESVKETIIEGVDPSKKPPKGAKIIRKFDNRTREVKVIARSKEAFLR